MKTFGKLALGALLAGSAAVVTIPTANAAVGVSIGVGVPGPYYGRSCGWYFARGLVAPGYCYNGYYGGYGPVVYGRFGYHPYRYYGWHRQYYAHPYRRW